MATSTGSEPTDHYDTLGVEPSASTAEIAEAYRRQARRRHPDVAPSGTASDFRRLREAYVVLSDPRRRADYDRNRGAAAGPGPAASGRAVPIPVHHRDAGLGSPADPGPEPHTGDRHIAAPVTFPQAALGGTIAVVDAEGDLVRLRIPAGTASGTTLRVVGHGTTATAGGRGDLYVTVRVEVPIALTVDQRRALEAFTATLDERHPPRTGHNPDEQAP